MKRTDDVSQVRGHSQKARNLFEASLEKLSQVLVDIFDYPIDPDFPKLLHAVLLVDSTINVLKYQPTNILCCIAYVGGYGATITKLVNVDVVRVWNQEQEIRSARKFIYCYLFLALQKIL